MQVYITGNFERQLKKLSKKYASLKSDFGNFIVSLKENPTQGNALGKSCYKVRMAITSKGKGKSAGARIITYFQIDEETISLLAIYDKSEKETISEKELIKLIELFNSEID